MELNANDFILTLLQWLAGGMIGLVTASLSMSFGARSADRLPGESRRPQCLYCSRPLTWLEAFPVIGWLIRPSAFVFPCPCGLRTGMWQQPACELAGFWLGFLAMALQGWSWAALPLCIGIGILPAITLIDFYFGIIPDGLNLLLGACGFLFIAIMGDDIYLRLAVAAALLCLGLFFALVYSKWRGKEVLGLGDVKFFAAAGLWLHPHTAATFLVLSGVFGLIFTLAWKRISSDEEFPFAPALCLSLAVCVLYRLTGLP